MLPDLKTPAERMRWARNKRGLSQAALAKKLDIVQQSIEKFENGAVRKPGYLADAAQVLDVPYEWLAKGVTPKNHHNDDFTQPETRPLIASDRVPVYGYVAGSTDRVAINDGKIIGMRERGPALAYAKEGFYVAVIGDSMEPRLRAGEYVAVNPSLPPIKGDECVVQYIDGEAIVKTFISQDAFNLKVSQYNPKKVLEISVKEIVSVYPVVAIEKGR